MTANLRSNALAAVGPKEDTRYHFRPELFGGRSRNYCHATRRAEGAKELKRAIEALERLERLEQSEQLEQLYEIPKSG
jgi:hypothetical protein